MNPRLLFDHLRAIENETILRKQRELFSTLHANFFLMRASMVPHRRHMSDDKKDPYPQRYLGYDYEEQSRAENAFRIKGLWGLCGPSSPLASPLRVRSLRRLRRLRSWYPLPH